MTARASAPSSFSIHRLAGCVGILGALLLFAGDMLLLGHFGSAADFRAGMLETIRSAPLARIWAGGLLGPIAGALLVAGFWQVCQSVQVPTGRSARAMFGLFVLFAVGLAAIHSVWAVFELLIQSCGSADGVAAACQALVAPVQGYMRLSLLALAVPAAIASVILAVLVLRGRTHLPRWTVLGPVHTNFGDRVARPGGWMQGTRAQQGRHLASAGNAADGPQAGQPEGKALAGAPLVVALLACAHAHAASRA